VNIKACFRAGANLSSDYVPLALLEKFFSI